MAYNGIIEEKQIVQFGKTDIKWLINEAEDEDLKETSPPVIANFRKWFHLYANNPAKSKSKYLGRVT